MAMLLHVPGATHKQLARGLAAAQAVLDAADVTQREAALGRWARDRQKVEVAAGALPTDEELEAAATFALAECAAIAACCEERLLPHGSRLEILDA